MRIRLVALCVSLCFCQAALAADSSADFQPVLVKPGDTLWGIANQYLKDPQKWDEILKHNRLPSSDPTVALPGMTLRVPVRLIKEELRAAYLVYRLNRVEFRRKETADWKSAKDSQELFRNDTLRTLENSKARVKFLSEDLLQLEPNSMAVLKPLNKDYDVELKRGGVFVGHAKIVTVSARITPQTKDTKYAATVRNDLSTLVEVYTGKADVEAEGQTVAVDAGMATEVRLGLAPNPPIQIQNLPDFQTRAAEFEGDLRATRAKIALSAPAVAGRAPGVGRLASAGAQMENLNAAVESMRLGEAISGYHIQLSRSQDFSKPAFDRNYEADSPIKISDITLPPGQYWVRIQLIDLLGTPGRFAPPKLYSLGGGALTQIKTRDLRGLVDILRPAADGQVETSPSLRVAGRTRGEVSISVNGQPARLDGEGNFAAVVTLIRGENEISVDIQDGLGNSDTLRRRVVYRPQ